jgi:flagellin FlaB
MKSTITNEHGFTGLEAAIVLIAFIVVAAVFSFVVLGAGFFTTQKSQETVHTAISQSTSTLQPAGQITIQANAGGDAVGLITFYLQLAAGSTGTEMSAVSYTVSTSQKTTTFGASDSAVDYDWVKEVSPVNHGDHAGLLSSKEMVYVKISPGFSATDLPYGSKFTVEVKPAVGAPILLTGTVPGAMSGLNWYEVY